MSDDDGALARTFEARKTARIAELRSMADAAAIGREVCRYCGQGTHRRGHPGERTCCWGPYKPYQTKGGGE